MTVLFRFLVYFVINWLGMSENVGFFDIEAIVVSQILAILASKIAKNGSKLAKIKVYLENTQNTDPEI